MRVAFCAKTAAISGFIALLSCSTIRSPWHGHISNTVPAPGTRSITQDPRPLLFRFPRLLDPNAPRDEFLVQDRFIFSLLRIPLSAKPVLRARGVVGYHARLAHLRRVCERGPVQSRTCPFFHILI